MAGNSKIAGMDTYSHMEKYLEIQSQDVYCKEDCTITILTEEYNFEENVIESHNIINIPGTFEIVFPKSNDSVKFYMPFKINIVRPELYNQTSKVIKLDYKKGDKVFFGRIKKVETDIMIIDKLLENQVKYLKGDISKQLEALWQQLLDTTNVQLMHLEILLSQVYLSDDNSTPLRMTGEDYSKKSARSIKESTQALTQLQGFAFGYSNDAILSNIAKEKKEPSTDIEKIIANDYEGLGQ